MYFRIMKEAVEGGLICYPTGGNVDGVKGDQIIIAPAYNATRDELDEIVSLLVPAIDRAVASI